MILSDAHIQLEQRAKHLVAGGLGVGGKMRLVEGSVRALEEGIAVDIVKTLTRRAAEVVDNKVDISGNATDFSVA